MKVKIVGNGIAALMLAEKLSEESIDVVVLGSGPSQAPPQVMVHLYAGRSFRRSKIEIDAFEESVRYWRGSPFSTETKVNRDTNPRLEKSVGETKEHPWEQPVLEERRFSYGPGFVVDANGLIDDIRRRVDYRDVYIDERNAHLLENCDQVIWATGFRSQLPYCSLNDGLSIAVPQQKTTGIVIGKGIHHASNSAMSSIGGAFLNSELQEPKHALLERAATILSQDELNVFIDGNIFVGKKSVSSDRFPVVGLDQNNEFVFTAFGARAFFLVASG